MTDEEQFHDRFVTVVAGYREGVMGPSHCPEAETWPGLIIRPARGPGAWPRELCAVLIHGAMDRGAGMAHVARQLRDAPTLRYDRRGYGRAATLAEGGLVRHVDDLIGIVEDRPVVLFGHSFGALVALSAAATGRIDVRGIATWEAPTPWIDQWPPWGLADPGDGDDTDPCAGRAEVFMRSMIGDDAWSALPERTRTARRREGAALAADVDPILASGVPFDPARIAAPCVFGAGDVSGAPYRPGATWLAEHVLDGRTLVVPGAPHGAPTAMPSMIAEMIRSVASTAATHDSSEPGADAFAR